MTWEASRAGETVDDSDTGEADNAEDGNEDENDAHDARDDEDEEDTYEARHAPCTYHAQPASCPQEVACSVFITLILNEP